MTCATCHVVLLTPPGRGAVATVLVAGVRAAEIVDRHFQSAANRPLAEFPVGRIVFGCWRIDSQSEGSEELVVCRTDENEVEIHCHGGSAASRAIVEALLAAGCEVCDWTGLLRSNSPDVIEAEARIALTSATTTKTAAVLLDQMHGALRREIKTIVGACEANDRTSAIDRLQSLHVRGRVGLRLTTPFRVVLAGRPNVGKSSLMNAILGYTRAIVFDQPGTTRDVVSATTAIDGWPIELSDTAGLRTSNDEIEAEGVARARRAASGADLLVLVFDATLSWTKDDEQLIDEFPQSLVVINKCDQRDPQIPARGAIATSAATGEGIAALIRAIGERLAPQPPQSGDAVPFTAGHVDAIANALAAATANDLCAAANFLRRWLA